MSRNLYVHIGMMKTGTTSIQSFCNNNKKKLMERGILYPNPTLWHTGHAFLSKCVSDLYNLPDRAYKNIIDNVIDEINSHNDCDVVISDEHLIYDKADVLQPIYKLFDNVIIIVVLREIGDFLESFCCYSSKDRLQSSGGGLSAILSNHIREWVDTFGLANCRAIDYNKATANNTLIKDVMAAIGIDSIAGFDGVPPLNSSLKTEYTMFAYHLQQLPLDGRTWWRCWGELERLNLEDAKAGKYLLVPQELYTRPSLELLDIIRYQARLLNDPEWEDRCTRPPRGRKAYGHKNLPVAWQHEIFGKFPQDLRQIINSMYPPSVGTDINRSILPDIPEFGSPRAELMQAWKHGLLRQINMANAHALDLRQLEAKNKEEMATMSVNIQEMAKYIPWLPLVYSLGVGQVTGNEHVSVAFGEAKGFFVEAIGDDPWLILPEIAFEARKRYMAIIDAEAEDDAWQFYYITEAGQEYAAERMVAFSVGNQGVPCQVILPESLPPQRLRLDIGSTPGKLRIKRLDICELPVNWQEQMAEAQSRAMRATVANIENFVFLDGMLYLSGWAAVRGANGWESPRALWLMQGCKQLAHFTPHITRSDVQSVLQSQDNTFGFAIQLQCNNADGLRLLLENATGRLHRQDLGQAHAIDTSAYTSFGLCSMEHAAPEAKHETEAKCIAVVEDKEHTPKSIADMQRDGWIESPKSQMYSVLWPITEGCNYKCAYCDCRKTFQKFTTAQQLYHVVDLLLSLKKPQYKITIYGGEPTYHPHCQDLIKYITQKEAPVYVSLITNGSRPYPFYENMKKIITPDYVIIFSVHLQFCDPEVLLTNIRTVAASGTSVLINFMLTPGYYDKAKYLADRIWEISETWPIKVYILTVFNEKGEFGVGLNEREQELLLEQRERFAHTLKGEKQRNDKYIYRLPPNPFDYSSTCNKYGIEPLYKYFYCISGANTLYIHDNGDIVGSLCRHGKYLGNAFQMAPEDLINAMDIVHCPADVCACVENIPLPKFRDKADAINWRENYVRESLSMLRKE